MTNILLCGAGGKMGHAVVRSAKDFEGATIAAGYDIRIPSDVDFPVYTSLSDIKEKIDVIIDFSHPSLTDGILDYAAENKIPAVICTTGLSGEQKGLYSGCEAQDFRHRNNGAYSYTHLQ